MVVKHRYLAAQIGPYGYAANEVRVLANGELALLGGQGGFQSVDGYSSLAIWNPADNSIVVYSSAAGVTEPNYVQPNPVTNIVVFTLMSNRSLIVEQGHNGVICTIDPAAGIQNVFTSSYGPIFPTPDGKSFLTTESINSVKFLLVLDSKTLSEVSRFPVDGDIGGDQSILVSQDSKTLYMSSASIIYAYDLATGKLIGWTPNLNVQPLSGGLDAGAVSGPQLQAIDGTGLIAGPMEEGVGFIDTSALQVGPVGTQFTNAYITPATGPASGGTNVEWDLYVSGIPAAVFFGSNLATDVGISGNMFTAITPAGSPGPVDVYTLMGDGGEQIVSEGYSYGPTILEATPDSSTPDGGGTGIVYGYGFGPSHADANAPIPTDLAITVGGEPATVTAYTSDAYGIVGPPFPLVAFAYTIPLGPPDPRQTSRSRRSRAPRLSPEACITCLRPHKSSRSLARCLHRGSTMPNATCITLRMPPRSRFSRAAAVNGRRRSLFRRRLPGRHIGFGASLSRPTEASWPSPIPAPGSST